MKRFIMFTSLAVLAMSTVAAHSAPADTVQERYAHAHWTWPRKAQIAALYPSEDDVEISLTLRCAIVRDGTLAACVVQDLAPSVPDVGQAAIACWERYVRVDPDTVAGGIQPGDMKTFKTKLGLG